MRRISHPPEHLGFNITPRQSSKGQSQTDIVLHYEEYEVLKLMDYELMSQEDAAGFMDVSRPTITRIYESARRKIARALVEGKDVRINGGNFEIDAFLLECKDCGARFSKDENSTQQVCPWCGSENVKPTDLEENV